MTPCKIASQRAHNFAWLCGIDDWNHSLDAEMKTTSKCITCFFLITKTIWGLGTVCPIRALILLHRQINTHEEGGGSHPVYVGVAEDAPQPVHEMLGNILYQLDKRVFAVIVQKVVIVSAYIVYVTSYVI